jgi:hypothetical protein
LRNQEIRERLRRVGAFIREWLWLPELLLLGGAAAYLGLAFGVMFIEWIRAGGVQ